jgi:serine/threonine protein kinase
MTGTANHRLHQAPIATGGYGCVYRPAIGCKGTLAGQAKEEAIGMVAKLQRVSATSQNEIRIGNIVKDLSGAERHFVTPQSVCTTDASLFPASLKSGCAPLGSSGGTSNQELVIMEMEDIPHYKLGTVPANAPQDVLKNMLRNLLVGLPHVLDGVSLLHSAPAPVVHFDLKADNIFAPLPPRLPLIADFGISFLPKEQTLETIPRTIIAYEPGYFVWPPEIHLLCYVFHRKDAEPAIALTEGEMETVAERVAASNPLYVNDPQEIRKRQNVVLAFYKSLSPVTGESLFQFVMDNWRAIDLYSVSICFANIFQAYKLGQSPSDSLTPLANQLLMGTSADPRQRPAVGQLAVAARKAVSGGTPAKIRALMSVREKAEANRGTAAVTLLGTERSLTRTSVR